MDASVNPAELEAVTSVEIIETFQFYYSKVR
jgi:hypothetical protein